jgi:hypothetical protein
VVVVVFFSAVFSAGLDAGGGGGLSFIREARTQGTHHEGLPPLFLGFSVLP